MADDPNPFEIELARDAGVLDGAIEHARAEIDAMRVAASAVDAASDSAFDDCSVHEVEGIGRYAIPFQDGWRPLISIIRDLSVNVDFSIRDYPSFDKIVADHFDSEALIDPLNDSYESGLNKGLRENIAAVRNFLMQTYYADTPEGMTPDKAKQSLEEIAAFVGDGLYNNLRLGGVIPNHDPSKPFIDMHRAAAGDGNGAQYIYEKILEMHRQSSWLRPFSAIVALFGGKPHGDWKLLPASQTPFHTWFTHNHLEPTQLGEHPTVEQIDAAMAHLDTLEQDRLVIEDAMVVAAAASDLDAIGNHLVYTAEQMPDVQTMSEPVRRDAIEIAKDILRRLRVVMGAAAPEQAMMMHPDDDLAALGGIRGVAKVYERLLAWGRGVDGTIMLHPSILAATQAIGQIGYLAKLEAIRTALKNGNTPQAQQLQQDLGNVPPMYKQTSEPNFAGLLDRVERGIDTVLNRVQTISGPGAAVGHTPGNELGSYMSGTPIAGTSQQAQAEGVGNRDQSRQAAQIQERTNSAARVQVQRVTTQLANQQRAAQGTSQAAPTRGSASAQLNAIRQRLAQARRNSTSQQGAQVAGRNNANRLAQLNIHGHHDDHDTHHGHEHLAATVAKIDPRILSNVRAATNVTGLAPMDISKQRANFQKMQKAATGVPVPDKNKPAPPPLTEEEKRKKQLQDQMMTPPPLPKGPGGMSR